MAASGRFIPQNPQKYAGDPTKIMFRSSWEVAAMRYFDSNPAVLKWASEEFSIPYIKPTDMRVHQYFPDFVIVYKNRTGAIVKEIIEIKPLKESLHENAKSDRDKVALAINIAKWQAAEAFAAKHGMKFRVVTEKSLFAQGPAKQKRKTPVRKK